MRQRAKQSFVEQFLAQPPDERFGEGILRRLTGRDVVPGDLVIVAAGYRITARSKLNVIVDVSVSLT
jgi:hypothetical protein